MTNRREFLQAAAVSALPAIAGAKPTATAGSASVFNPGTVNTLLIDERHAAARAAGAILAARGTTVHAIPDGDVTQVWLNHIGPAWRREPVAVAGLTARPALFCLEQLAFGAGLRVVFHSEHLIQPDGKTEHWLSRGAQAASLSSRDLQRAGSLWPALIADAIATHRGHRGRVRPGPSDATQVPRVPVGAQWLTSWIIATA